MKRSDSETLELIARTRRGDEDAAETLLRDYKQTVASVARNYFLVGGDEDDLAQEGMIGLYKAIMKYDPARNDNFDAYAAMSVHRQIQTAIKTANRDKNKPISEGLDLAAAERAVAALSTEEAYLMREERLELGRAYRTLGEIEREILTRYLAGESYAAIGAAMGVDAKKVDNTLQAVKHKLRAQMNRPTR